MSKKTSIRVRVREGEACVVGPVDRWSHLAEIYEAFAEWYPDEADAWFECAEWIRDWVHRTSVAEDNGDENWQ